jgi:hypothetical protein
MLNAKQMRIPFGSHVTELPSKETRQAILPKGDKSLGVAAVWIVFYAIIAVAAVLHHV